MHITAIRKFIADHPRVKTDRLTTSQINSAFVKPETIGTKKPYIQKFIDTNNDTAGTPFVSEATVFVSHAWSYVFSDVVAEVMEQYASKHPDAYF